MKTINTILPIYDSLEKQERYRTKSKMPILTSRYRLPSFQWKDESDEAATVSNIELMGENNVKKLTDIGFNSWHPSSWELPNGGSFTSVGLEIISAHNISGNAFATTNEVMMTTGQVVIINCNVHTNGCGLAMQMYEYHNIATDYYVLNEGMNSFTHTITNGGYSNNGLFSIVLSLGLWGDYTISLTNVTIGLDNFSNFFSSLPASHALTSDVYFQYKGTTLNYLLPYGTFYLKITMNNSCVYYSELFVVTDIYENILTDPDGTSSDYYTFTHSGNAITRAVSVAGGASAYSNKFPVKKGEVIKAIFFLKTESGELPYIDIEEEHTGGSLSVISNQVHLAAGLNEVLLTVTASSATAELRIFNTAAAIFITSEIILIRSYSPNFMSIAFGSTYDLGDILYHDGFTQLCFLEAMLNNPTHEVVETGEEKNGIFVAEKIVTKYKYKIIANVGRQLYTALMRLPQHDTITITDEVGNVYTPKVGNIWVSAPNWIFYDIARIEIQFNDNSEFVWTSENNNLT